MTKYIAKIPDENGLVHFTAEEHGTWQILIDRQLRIIENRACDEYLLGLEKLNLPKDRIPQCHEVSDVLMRETGWSVAPVKTIIPLEDFFGLLANKQFPAATFIRIREELDYLQEPDIFHEFFGHCPLLTNQAYADFVHWYGQKALTTSKKVQSLLGRLFWFTVEFGLLRTAAGLRIYGGGILSSFEETVYALESDQPEHLEFDVNQVLHTPYRYDELQKKYFVMSQLSDLYRLQDERMVEFVERIVEQGDGEDFVIC